MTQNIREQQGAYHQAEVEEEEYIHIYIYRSMRVLTLRKLQHVTRVYPHEWANYDD